jgi:hypothetical protein
MCKVSLWDVTAYHSLKVDYEVESNRINVVAIYDDNVLAPFLGNVAVVHYL